MTELEKTTLGLAKLVKHEYKNLKYDQYGIFYYYKGDEYGYYEALDPQRDYGIQCLIYEVLMSNKVLDRIKSSVFREVTMVLKLDPSIRIEEMDTDHNKIGMLNGVFDVVMGVVSPHSSDNNITMVLNTEFSDASTCPLFKEFLYGVLGNDQVAIDNMLMIGGFILFCNDPEVKSKVEKMFVFTGEGGNGKSVLIRIFRSLFHKKYLSSLSLQELTASSANPVRAPLITSRLNICSEGKENDIIKGDDELKKIISGEEINIKQLYSDVKEIRSRTKVIQLSNHSLLFGDLTHSLRRRLITIHFNNTYLETRKYNRMLTMFGGDTSELEKRNTYLMDKGLVDKLLGERSGIFNWFHEGYQRLLENNLEFNITSEMEERLVSDLYSHNPIYNFIEKFCQVGEDYSQNDHFTPMRGLYDQYLVWYKSNWQERGKHPTPNTFNKKVRQLFSDRIVEKRVRKYICMNPEEWEEDKQVFKEKMTRCFNIVYVGNKEDGADLDIAEEGNDNDLTSEQFNIPF